MTIDLKAKTQDKSQLIKCLLCMLENQNSDPNINTKVRQDWYLPIIPAVKLNT